MAKKKTAKKPEVENGSILIISDLHAPYNHPDAVEFLGAVGARYRPNRVVCIGDEMDYHAMSFHESNPDLPSASFELQAARKVLGQIEAIFPNVDLVSSNHGDMKYRKAKWAGIPSELIVPYEIACDVGDGWNWHKDITITLPNGERCFLVHQYEVNARLGASHLGMCLIQGHYHTRFEISYVSSPKMSYWGMTVGCLIDDPSLAFTYNKTTPKRPILGTAMIVDSRPQLVPMLLDDDGRWNGTLI